MLNNSWVVIPAHNEADTISAALRSVSEVVPRIVVVDDGSRDATSAKALAAGATVLYHTVNLGQGAALETGIRYALSQGAEYIFTFDADGQHDVEALVALSSTLESTGADVVLGSRTLGHTDGMPLSKRLLLKLAVAFTRMHSGLGVSDTHNGLRLMTRDAAMRIRISQPRMAHASEILAQIRSLGLRWAEAPVSVRYTEYSIRKGQPISAAFGILLELFYANLTR
jgi:polyprenyl-phospho-N-acetylgalactosaminyl synthase